MSTEEQDYLPRIWRMLAEMLRKVTQLRSEGRLGEALSHLTVAQESLFGRPVAQVGSLPLADQLRLLAAGETPEAARAKALAYADLLAESGMIFAAQRDKEGLARSAWVSALYVLLHTAELGGRETADEVRARVEEMLPRVSAEPLPAPVEELLGRFRAIL